MAVNRDPIIPNPAAVAISPTNGEFFFFRVLTNGTAPQFLFKSDFKGMILNQGRFPQNPAEKYEWTYLRDPSDIHQLETLSLALIFAASSQYRYQVTINDQNGPLRDVLDIRYEGGVTDFETEPFRVVIQ